ncbi:MAG: hypothetical protein OEY77_12120 [Nitrospira sp.]|nr:hypothetical protein [Nitrospira sp.]MDH5741062.1 hypothetical protein [Nitrospira sp.]
MLSAWLLGKAEGGDLLDRRLIVLFSLAVAVNYPWERAQSRLYVLPNEAKVEWWMCAAASVADGLVVLLLFRIGWLVVGQRDWYLRPGASGCAVILLSGAVVSIVVEWIAIYGAQWWAYSPRMPLVPWLNVGLVPLGQMLVLPPLIFSLLAWWHRKMIGE